MTILRYLLLITGLLFSATACTTADLSFHGNKMKGFAFSRNEPLPQSKHITLSNHPGELGETKTENTIRDVMDLAKQKRFREGRMLLEKVRSSMEKNSDGFNAVTASMAILALREGDFTTFMQITGRLDQLLGEPVRVEESYAGIITLYRAVNGNTLPVNAPEKLRHLGSSIQKTANLTTQ